MRLRKNIHATYKSDIYCFRCRFLNLPNSKVKNYYFPGNLSNYFLLYDGNSRKIVTYSKKNVFISIVISHIRLQNKMILVIQVISSHFYPIRSFWDFSFRHYYQNHDQHLYFSNRPENLFKVYFTPLNVTWENMYVI